MEDGLSGVHGSYAQLHVKKDSKRERGPALTPLQNVGVVARVMAKKLEIVTPGSSARV